MLFNSLQFAVFFPVVTILYFLLPHKFRWMLLLGASMYFYMVFVPYYILILGVTIVVDYFAGIWIEEARSAKKRKVYLVLSLVANIGFLAFFKYFNFLNSNIAGLADLIGWNYPIENLNIILPIGLSFYTFQAMSYTIEVFRRHQKTERHFGIFALYVMFFPQLFAGPIERPQNMLHQYHEEHFFDYQRVADGLKLMTWGLFKKVVIADRLAAFVNTHYADPSRASGPLLAVTTVCFAFQIFCDFSGYSDIAIGAAQVMGFKLMTNFKRPYLALSISEFWKRWHMSLSFWFRDYLFLPLAFATSRRLPKERYGGISTDIVIYCIATSVTFLLCGLWHGAAWTFVVWGALHGMYLILERQMQKIWKIIPRTFRSLPPAWLRRGVSRVIVFTLVGFAWVFFRATSLGIAHFIVAKMLSDWSYQSAAALRSLLLKDSELLITFFFIAFMETIHYFQERGSVRAMLATRPAIIRWVLYTGILVCIIVFGKIYIEPTQFIYFQF
jgi:alginate O-acetyltransferase complex protein AlgI